MSLKDNFDVIFDEPYYVINGEEAKGKLIIYYPKEDVQKISLHILPEEYWTVKNGSSMDKALYSPPFRAEHIELNLDNIEYMYDENKIIKKNMCVKPFSINIPGYYSPFFEYTYKDIKHAHIRYQLTIKMTIKNREISKNMHFPILSKPFFTNKMDFCKEVKQNLEQSSLSNKGEIGFKVYLNDFCFKYNSICEVLMDIDNTKGQLATEEYKVVLRRKIKFYEDNPHKEYNEEKEIIVIKEKAKVGVGERKSFKCKFNIEDKENNQYNQEELNKYYKNYNINFFVPSIKGNIIQCEYEIKVSLYFEKFVDYNHRPRLIFPISMSHKTAEDYLKIEIINPIGLNTTNEISNQTPDNNNNNNNNQFTKI